MTDDADLPLTESVAETRLDRIEQELRAEPSLKLMQITRKPDVITVSRGNMSVDFAFPNMGDVQGGHPVIAAILHTPGVTPQQLAVITTWDKAEFLGRLKALDAAPSGNKAIKRMGTAQVQQMFSQISTDIDHRLAGVAGNTRKIAGKTLTVLMVQRNERHTFTYVDHAGGKAAVEVRTTQLKAPMETRRLPDIRMWETEEFLDVVLGNRWNQGIIEKEGA
jgi:hypothetical protein